MIVSVRPAPTTPPETGASRADAALTGLGGQFARLGRIRRAHVDDQGSGIDGVEQALVEHDLPDDRRRGEHQHDHIHPGRRLRERFDGSLSGAGTGGGIHIEAAHLVPRLDQPGGHRHAHVTEPDEADSHPGPRRAPARQLECVEPRLHAAADGRLQQRLLNLLLRAAVGQRPADVRAQLLWAVERGQHGDVQQAPCPAIETLAVPDRAPAVLGDELLHRAHEGRGLLERAVDVLSPEHGAPRLQPALVPILGAADAFVFHAQPSPYSSSVTGSSQSCPPSEIARWSR
jgi:hypothetical protein